MNKLEEILMFDDILEIINREDELFSIIPELEPMVTFDQKNPAHIYKLWEHTLNALSYSEKDFEIRLTLLLHDIGKLTCFIEGDIRHYYNHGIESRKVSYNILKRLGYEEEFILKICKLIEEHDMPITKGEVLKDRTLAIKKYKIQKCDIYAHSPLVLEKRKIYLKKVKSYFE